MSEIVKPMLAFKWEEDQDPSGWYMSEKLDGVRAIWTGSEFLSRAGNKFFAPACFTQHLPKAVLDGELYGGRGQFQRTVGIVKHKVPNEQDWMGLTYNVFEAPTVNLPFEIVSKGLLEVKATYQNAPIVVAIQTVCEGLDHLQGFLSDVVTGGGEGIMLRNPASYYLQDARADGRSKHLLKVKIFKNNKARVIGYQLGAGKYTGMVGALCCAWIDHEAHEGFFQVGSGLTDYDRAHPPEINSIIKFSYFELTNVGIPRFPVFQGKV